jgi:hypothetical protein
MNPDELRALIAQGDLEPVGAGRNVYYRARQAAQIGE